MCVFGGSHLDAGSAVQILLFCAETVPIKGELGAMARGMDQWGVVRAATWVQALFLSLPSCGFVAGCFPSVLGKLRCRNTVSAPL